MVCSVGVSVVSASSLEGAEGGIGLVRVWCEVVLGLIGLARMVGLGLSSAIRLLDWDEADSLLSALAV